MAVTLVGQLYGARLEGSLKLSARTGNNGYSYHDAYGYSYVLRVKGIQHEHESSPGVHGFLYRNALSTIIL